MASTSEKGHAKNVDNLSLLIEICKGFGSKYNPARTSIKIANLVIKLNDSKTQAQTLKDKNQDESTARNNRKVAFKTKGTYSTQILAAIKTCDVTDELKEDAVSINKKIQGERLTETKKPKPTTESTPAEDAKTISTSQQSFTNVVDHYKKYKTLITSMGTDYAPNETEVQLASINTFITNLETHNNNVNTAESAASNALIARDKGYYDPKTGIPETAYLVKEYVKQVYKANSPEYKMVAKIPFTYPPKKD